MQVRVDKTGYGCQSRSRQCHSTLVAAIGSDNTVPGDGNVRFAATAVHHIEKPDIFYDQVRRLFARPGGDSPRKKSFVFFDRHQRSLRFPFETRQYDSCDLRQWA